MPDFTFECREVETLEAATELHNLLEQGYRYSVLDFRPGLYMVFCSSVVLGVDAVYVQNLREDWPSRTDASSRAIKSKHLGESPATPTAKRVGLLFPTRFRATLHSL